MEDKKWEFECPQVFDFNNLNKDDSQIESYFDKKNEIEKKESIDDERAKRKRRVFRFTAESSLLSKPIIKDEEKVKNIFGACSKPNLQRKTLRPSFEKFRNVKRRSAISTSRKPFMVPKISVKQPGLPVVGEQQVPLGAIRERIPHRPAQQENRFPPAPTTSIPRRQRTHPTTPECLKRSLNKVKTIKSSEQLELEKIAVMRRKLKNQLLVNKATMEKTRGPALRPLIQELVRSPMPPSQKTRCMPVSSPQIVVTNDPSCSSSQSNMKNDKRKGKMECKKFTQISKTKASRNLLQSPSNLPNNSLQDRRRSRSADSYLLNFPDLDSSVQGRSRIKSLNVCHSGIKFIPKQATFGSSKKKASLLNQENKELLVSPKKTGDKEIKSKEEISKPFQDKTNVIEVRKTIVPKQLFLPFSKSKGLKRKSADSFIDLKRDKKVKL